MIKFEDGEFSLDVKVSPDEDTVWLTQRDLTLLFNVDKSRISRHIKNILDEGELDFSVVVENATTGTDGKTYSTRYYKFYCLKQLFGNSEQLNFLLIHHLQRYV